MVSQVSFFKVPTLDETVVCSNKGLFALATKILLDRIVAYPTLNIKPLHLNFSVFLHTLIGVATKPTLGYVQESYTNFASRVSLIKARPDLPSFIGKTFKYTVHALVSAVALHSLGLITLYRPLMCAAAAVTIVAIPVLRELYNGTSTFHLFNKTA